MAGLTVEAKEALLTVFTGQHVNPAGIIESESNCIDCSIDLISNGLIKVNQWYRFHQIMTTTKGSEIARSIIREREQKKQKIR